MRERREETRPLSEIALEIQDKWRHLSYAAVTPVAAMCHLRHIDDRYGGSPARAVVLDFLGCSASWTGPAARRIKAELIGLLEDAPRQE
jgi:hypothetical protein